jgi:hypothetical protein
MLEPDEVAAMMRLHRLGWGSRRLAQQFGCSRTTVKRYVAAGGWQPCARARRRGQLDGLAGWLRERFLRHRGSADVVRQDLEREHRIAVSTGASPPGKLRADARCCPRAHAQFSTPDSSGPWMNNGGHVTHPPFLDLPLLPFFEIVAMYTPRHNSATARREFRSILESLRSVGSQMSG